MTGEELLELINRVVQSRSEYQNIELKAAKKGCPEKFYDTLSSFSNRDDGGIIIFGIDEKNNFDLCGVYDLQDIQQKITEQCNAMTPIIRPLFSYAEMNDRYFCSVEVPSVDITERPCYYSGKGRLKGSYIRVGTCDEPMTEYEVYSYEAYRKKYQDDIRLIPRVSENALDTKSFEKYIEMLSESKPNLSKLSKEQIMELMSLKVNGQYSLVSTVLFGIYPQAYFPQLCIIATAIPGDEIGDIGEKEERFLDNIRIEGTIQEMLTQAIAFVRKNTRTKTIVDSKTGERRDVSDYPITAVREVVLNALVHRDYSIHTEGMPIQLQIFKNRIEITNPGGLYGRISLDKLGQVQPDTRNPILATALELLKITENRYSGIPTIRREMAEYGLPAPQFVETRGSFKVILWGEGSAISDGKKSCSEKDILAFCAIPRSRQDIAEFLGIKAIKYATQKYVAPLVSSGELQMTIPEHPKSPAQRYFSKKE